MAKRLIFVAIALALALAVAAALIMRLRRDHLEGYYAPVFAADGDEIYFLRRETRGISWGLGYEFFSPPAHVYVLSDRFSLERLDPATGRVARVLALPASPFEGRHLRHYRGRLYGLPSVRLRWAEDGALDYAIRLSTPRQPRAEVFGLAGGWDARAAAAAPEGWRDGGVATVGYNEAGVGADAELLTPTGRQGFPAAIVLFRPQSRSQTTLLASDGLNQVEVAGPLLSWLEAQSRFAEVTRLRELRATRSRLIAAFQAQGLDEGAAILAADKELQRLGFYPKQETVTLVARPIDDEKRRRYAARGLPLFEIAVAELQSGVFPDIERALAEPGHEVEKHGGAYLIHRDYTTSARLNAHLATGAAEFLVSFRDSTYILSIRRR